MRSSTVISSAWVGVAILAPTVLAEAQFGGFNFGGSPTDIFNCGRLFNVCKQPFLAPVSGFATCTNGVCGMSCGSGFTYNAGSNDCLLGASGRTRAKKSKTPKPVSLCPTGETACPIAGSASFDTFVQSSDQTADFFSAKGGYECIDTTENVESCGGCASTGKGVDVSVENCFNGPC